MKKISKLSIIFIIMLLVLVGLTANVYAKPNCTINMQPNQTEVNKGKEFTIDVNLSNIQSERGIIAIEATLEYEKNCLTLLKMEGQNNWDTPIKDLSYNEANGKLVIDKKGLAKNDEIILKITFLVNDTNKTNASVTLRNIIVADGTQPATISDAHANITINEKPGENQKPDEKPGTNPGENQNPDEGQKPDTKPNPDEGQKPDVEPTPDQNQTLDTNTTTDEQQKPNTNNKDNTATGKLPQTGKENKNVLIIVIALLVLGAMIITFIYKKKKR